MSDITESGKSIENFKWIRLNMTPEKIGQVIRIQEQMVPTRTVLQMQGKHQETITRRLCKAHPERIMHWMSTRSYLAGFEYLKRHYQALKVFYMALAKKVVLLDPKLARFNVRIAPVIENDEASIHWIIKMATHTTVVSLARFKSRMEEKTIDRSIWHGLPTGLQYHREGKRKDQGLQPALLRLAKTHRVVFYPSVIGATGRLNSIWKEINSVMDEIKVTDSIVREMQKTVVVYT